MKNKDILLTLPGTLKVRDINWLSVWCMRFTVNYGEVYIPKDLKIPEKVVISLIFPSFFMNIFVVNFSRKFFVKFFSYFSVKIFHEVVYILIVLFITDFKLIFC